MNWADFFAMNGYGFYVWGSYGVALLVFVVERLRWSDTEGNSFCAS